MSRAVPHMKTAKFGRIINIGSISGVMGEAHASLYSSTKAGLIGLSKATGLELAEYGITVNTINPGWVDTELGKCSIEDSEFSQDEIISCIPQKTFRKTGRSCRTRKIPYFKRCKRDYRTINKSLCRIICRYLIIFSQVFHIGFLAVDVRYSTFALPQNAPYF